MNLRKLSVTFVVIALMSIGFGNIVSDTARAAFIDPLSGAGLSSGFTPKSVEWNSAGTMAIVTGHDSASGPNTYIYWPTNDTYYPLSGGSGFQYMYDVDYFPERVPPSVLVVDADYYNTLAPAYTNALSSCNADVTVWDVYAGAAPASKPKSSDMAGYDAVIWIPSRDMWGGIAYDAFSSADEAEVGSYLDAGGNFMLSNVYYTDYTPGGGLYAPGMFPYDYLGIDRVVNRNSPYDDYVNNTIGDLAFGGLGQEWLNWNQYGWTTPPPYVNDEIIPAAGKICFWGTDSTLTTYAPMGIRYDSTIFKSVFLGFPFEVQGSTGYMNGTMRKALEWFVPGSQARQASVLLVDADYYSDGLVNAYDWALTNNSARVTIWDVYGNNGPAQGKPVTANMNGYDLVIWIPTRDMWGGSTYDAFSAADENEVSGYLGTGGNFFLSNIYWSDYTAGGGFYASGNFAYDVFGIGSMTSQWSGYEDYVQGYSGDAVFGSFGPAWQDWNRFNWGGTHPAASDIISPFSAISCIESYQSTPLNFGTGGVYWNQGTFKSMFMGFPFETLQYPESDDFWARALEWFVPGSTSYNPELFTYRDAWWVCGDTGGGPSTVYKVVPGQALALQTPAKPITKPFKSIAVDGDGNPLAAGSGLADMWYYYGKSWHPVNKSGASLAAYNFEGIDFNPNEGRFYAVGSSGGAPAFKKIFYTDKVPLDSATSYCHEYVSPSFSYTGTLYGIAWNNLHDYGLAVGANEIFKVWPYSYYNNGTMKWSLVNSSADTYYDVSWDSDGWNEAGIVGSQSPSLDGMYWRYYNSNPVLIEGFDSNSGLPYYACAMKPPSSPKWLFIPLFNGGWQVNILLKDQSKTLTVNADYPHIFILDVWKQNDLLQGSLLNTQLDADSIYTFFIEGNYTKGGTDLWLNLQVNLTAWYDNGTTGSNSNPEDQTWTLDNNRTKQFNLTYLPSTTTATMNYPLPGSAPPEFSVYSVWEDPVLYGTDSSRHRVYINVSFGAQTYVAASAFANGAATLGRIYDVNSALNDANTWDYNVTMYDTTTPNAQNTSFEEFGIKKYASVSVSGNPSGSIPPGAVNYMLTTPSQIHYSSNSDYYVNISIPNLYKNGVVGPDFIPASNVAVQNTHSLATNLNSDISLQMAFIAPNTDYCVWGTPGIPLQQVLNGTESAGPEYSDFSTGPGIFEVTEVYWWVSVPAGLPEGVYWATITVTIWN